MKTLMIIFLAGFLLFGAIGLYFRLTHDWNALTVETDKLDDNSIAKRDGRAMKLTNREAPDAEAVAKSKVRAEAQFKKQMIFSVLSVLCLVAAVVCGAMMP